MEDPFVTECKARFQLYCRAYKAAKYHSQKRLYMERAYAQVEAYLDWRDIQGL